MGKSGWSMLCLLVGDDGWLLVTEAKSRWPPTVPRAVPTSSSGGSRYTVRIERTTKPLPGPSTQGESNSDSFPTESPESEDWHVNQAKGSEVINKLSLASSPP